MNKLVKVPDSLIPPTQVRNLIAVESVTDVGAPYTWATIIKNKHRRVNLSRVSRGAFIAGSNNSRDVQKFARTVSPDTTVAVFIEDGNIINVRR